MEYQNINLGADDGFVANDSPFGLDGVFSGEPFLEDCCPILFALIPRRSRVLVNASLHPFILAAKCECFCADEGEQVMRRIGAGLFEVVAHGELFLAPARPAIPWAPPTWRNPG